MELTKDEAVRLHRELWDWLSKNPNEDKEDWPGWKDFDEDKVRANIHCFACAFTGNNPCRECLLVWPGMDCCSGEERGDNRGIYSIWGREANFDERTRFAEQIRDLPVRDELLEGVQG